MVTGGNIYNSRMISQLVSMHQVETKIVPEDIDHFLRQEKSFSGFENASVFLTDSLLLHHRRFLKWLSVEYPLVPNILLVHYLTAIDPVHSSNQIQNRERDRLLQFDGFITTSEYSREQLVRLGVGRKTTRVVQPGIHPLPARPDLPLPDIPAPRILTVSSIFPGKGLPEVVELLEQLLHMEWEWYLAGDDHLDPEYARQFDQKLRHSSISKRATYLGALKQEVLLSQYRQYDIFLLPSQFESCSMVTMEAMAAGLPVVAFAVGGLPELIADGLNGFSVPAGNWSVLRAKLQVLLTDQSLRKALGTDGYHRSKKFPTWKNSARCLSDFLSGVVLKRPGKKLPDFV